MSQRSQFSRIVFWYQKVKVTTDKYLLLFVNTAVLCKVWTSGVNIGSTDKYFPAKMVFNNPLREVFKKNWEKAVFWWLPLVVFHMKWVFKTKLPSVGSSASPCERTWVWEKTWLVRHLVLSSSQFQKSFCDVCQSKTIFDSCDMGEIWPCYIWKLENILINVFQMSPCAILRRRIVRA